MKTKQISGSPKKYIIFIIIAITLALLTIIFLCIFPKERRNDYSRFASESYDTAFLSMYPTDYFYEEDFSYWRGLTTVKAAYEIPDYSTLKSYLNVIGKSGNIIHTIYLGVLPEKLSADQLAALLQSYPSVHFEIILPNPSMDYWLSMSDDECADTITAYRDFILPLLQYGNMSLYYFGATEWLISNPANYDSHFQTTAKASLTIMLNSDRDHRFLLDVEKAEEQLEKLTELIAQNRSTPLTYPDLSDYSIVFLGDSVIGNYDGATSIPGVVEGLTGATVFNLGLGGGKAAETPDNNCSLSDITTALITRDISDLPLDMEVSQDAQLQKNLSIYLEAEPTKELCFVINYGLNDYFSGLPITSESPLDIYTYGGAMKTAVKQIQEAFPNAKILLMTPNFTSYYGNGTEHRYDAHHTLKDYTDTLFAVAQELDVLLLDNFNELGINADNHSHYLSDGCHPNETGRFLIGQRIALKLNSN